MAKKNNASTKQESDPAEAEHPLQAVMIADSVNERFMPITLEKPRCLLPLANVPLIDYTLEFLATAGVQEVFVFCKAHADMIRNYLHRHPRWSRPRSGMTIHTILAPSATSVGDVLRDLDAKSLIQSDFILVSGDVISNMKLDAVLEQHRTRRAANKDVIMTMMMKRASPEHRTRAIGEAAIVALDPRNSEVVHYEVLAAFPPKRRVSLDPELFDKRPVLQLHNDLIDCQIDICSPEVPLLFSENFDYQDLRHDFVRGILTSDLLGKTIHCHIIGSEYASRVRSTQMYDAISKDVISRWTFPMVPDSNIFDGSDYQFSRNFIYKEKDISLSRSCIVQEKTVLGSGTEVGDFTLITNSVIGRNNVVVDGAYIWDNVTIENDCTVVQSILADGVKLKSGVVVERGCLLSFNTVVGPSVVLPPFTKLSLMKQEDVVHESAGYSGYSTTDDETANEGDVIERDAKEVIGTEGVGYIWHEEEEYSSDDEAMDPRNRKVWDLGRRLEDFTLGSAELNYASSDMHSEMDESDYDFGNELERHYQEAEETVRRSIQEGHSVDNCVLELNALKMACNITFHDLRASAFPALIRTLDVSNAKEFLAKWSKLFSRLITSEHDQIDTLWICLRAMAKHPQGQKLIVQLLVTLYNRDVLDEDIILEWYNDKEDWDDCTDAEKKLRVAMLKFVNYLIEAEEESEEEESESEEED